jgi:glutamate-1-semialdehyde 2,1-aminomutase
VNRFGAAAHGFISATAVATFREAEATDTEQYRSFVAAMLDEGVHMIPRGLLYVSTAHTAEDLESTRRAAHSAGKQLAAKHVGIGV